MNFKHKLVEMMYKKGMHLDDAKAVLEQVIADPSTETMKGVWLDDVLGHPESVIAVLWLTTSRLAIEYLEQYKPESWCIGIFKSAHAHKET
jgi:hypothetical protein